MVSEEFERLQGFVHFTMGYTPTDKKDTIGVVVSPNSFNLSCSVSPKLQLLVITPVSCTFDSLSPTLFDFFLDLKLFDSIMLPSVKVLKCYDLSP